MLCHPRRQDVRCWEFVPLRTVTTPRSSRRPRRKLRRRRRPSPRRSPQLRLPGRERARANEKPRARASASAGTSTTSLLVARRAPRAPSCTRPRRWLRRWEPRALLISRMLRGRSASRLAALALCGKPGRRRQLSRRPSRASQCGFWIPAPANTW